MRPFQTVRDGPVPPDGDPGAMLIARAAFLLAVVCLALPVVLEAQPSGMLTITKFTGVLAALLTCWAVALGRIRPLIDIPSVALIMLFTLWGWVGQMVYGEAESVYIIKMLMNLVLALMVMQFVRSPRDLSLVLYAYLCGAFIASSTGILEINSSHGERIAGVMMNANNFGQVCAHAAILAVGLFGYRKSRTIKAMLVLVVVVALVGLIFSGSRGAVLALLAGLFILFIIQTQRVKILFFAGVFAFLVVSVAPSYFQERFQWAFKAKARQRVSGLDIRLSLAKEGIKIFINHPVFGVGMGNVVPEMRKQMGHYWVTHNAFTQLLAETGLIGFLIFVFLLFRAGRRLFRKARSAILPHRERALYGAVLALMAVLVVAESSSGNYNRAPWFFLFGVVGGLFAEPLRKREKGQALPTPGHADFAAPPPPYAGGARAEVVERILDAALLHPHWDGRKISDWLRLAGNDLDAPAVEGILSRQGMGTDRDRQLHLEDQCLHEGLVLTPEQAAFIEEMNPCFKERHENALRPGELLGQDTFYLGNVQGIGQVYLQAVVDACGCYAFGHLHTEKTPAHAAALLEKLVLPQYGVWGLPVRAIITDGGREYCGTDHHPYHDCLALHAIEHRRSPVTKPWPNGSVERFHKTVMKEFFDEALRGAPNASLEALQSGLDRWLTHYNTERPHHGFPNMGRRPIETISKFINARIHE